MKNKFILLVLFLPILCFSVDFESNRIYDNKNVTIDNFLYEKKLDKPLVFLNSEIENSENKIDVFLNEQQYYYRIINDDDSITQKIKIDKLEILEFLPINSITIGLYNDDVSKPIIFENYSKTNDVITLKIKNFNLEKNQWCIVDSFVILPFDCLEKHWENLKNELVRESISNFVANASNINSNFYNSVTKYFETNKATLLPGVSITNKCKQPVKVQIGDEVFDLNRLTTTNIVNSFLFDKESVQIKYWVTNNCPDSKCPITTNVFKQTFNKYNRDDYVLTLENIPLQKDLSYVSITNIPQNAKVEFFNVDVKELSRTNGIIKIQTNSHTTNGFFVVEQDYYAPLTNQFTSGHIKSTTTNACPELELLNWQNCSITNTSEHPCDIKISYSNIINDVAIAIIDDVTIAPNSMTNYVLDSKSIDPIDVIFSWNTNTTAKTFKRIINDPINIEVQGKKEDPLDVFKKKYDLTDKTIRLSRNNIISQYKAIKDPFVDTKISTENLSNLCKKYVKEDVRVILSDDFAKALKLDKLSQDEINDIIKIVFGE